MKKINLTLIVIATFVCIFVVIAYILPSRVEVSRSIFVKSSAIDVFDQVNQIHQWKNWSPWYKQDTTVQYRYFGADFGEGAGFDWTSSKNEIGRGSIVFNSSIIYDSIGFDIDFTGKGKGSGSFIFNESDTGVVVEWRIVFILGYNPIKRYFGLTMDKIIGAEFEKGLQDIKIIAERNPFIKLQYVAVPAFNYISIRKLCENEKVSDQMTYSYAKLFKYIKANNLDVTSSPFAIYHSTTNIQTDIETGFPVKLLGKSVGDIRFMQMPESESIVADYYGPLNGLDKAHICIQRWITRHHKKLVGAPWEKYMSDTRVESNPSKWLTKVFYPVK